MTRLHSLLPALAALLCIAASLPVAAGDRYYHMGNAIPVARSTSSTRTVPARRHRPGEIC